jgi:hypothetical protein
MLNAAELLAEALGAKLANSYASAFIGREPRQEASVAEATKLVLERIGSSDALYHSAEVRRSSRSSARTFSEASGCAAR